LVRAARRQKKEKIHAFTEDQEVLQMQNLTKKYAPLSTLKITK
jgi:hypothetical protein